VHMDGNLAFCPALEMAKLIKNKQISPIELTNSS
jgi:hypothetical protein